MCWKVLGVFDVKCFNKGWLGLVNLDKWIGVIKLNKCFKYGFKFKVMIF